MWQQAVLVLATAAAASSFYTQYAFPQVVYMNPNLRTGQPMKYDCQSAGFFVNPQNCSQFYRCVDYVGTGQVFAVYVFECPRFHVFMVDGVNSTCIPGTECVPGLQTAAHVTSPPEITPEPVTPAPVTPAPVTPAPVTPAPVTPAPVTPAPAPVVADQPATDPPATEPPVVVQPHQTPAPPVVDCLGQFVQHEVYCNVYYKCSIPGDNFLCPAGSVFDTVRQMCRIQGADQDLCGGKSIYSASFRYASRVALGNVGSINVPSFTSFTPQNFIQVPHSQPNYLAFFNPHHPLRRNQQAPFRINQQGPLQYIQPFTAQFTQGHSAGHSYTDVDNVVDTYHVENLLPHPEPENIHPRQYFRATDGDSQYRPEPEMVHPRQYYVPIDSELNADAMEFY